jgi:hypothetical protein
MSNSELKMGSTIVDFEGDGEFAATHMVAHAGHSVNGTSTLTSHVAQSPKRERLHSGALHSTSFLCFDMKSISPSLQVTGLRFTKPLNSNFLCFGLTLCGEKLYK